MQTIQVNIITGFLGSGKTTVISNLLKSKPSDEKWTVVINEFGEISIDSITLQSEVGNKDSIIEIAGGCICCSSMDYFKTNLSAIIEQQQPDRILIEPTGLGGISSVCDIISEFAVLDLKPVVCLVDVNSFGNARMQMNQIYLSQIRDSDIIVVSKCDLEGAECKSDKLIQWVKEKFCLKQDYLTIKNGCLPVNLLTSIKGEDREDENSRLLKLMPIMPNKNDYINYAQSFTSDVFFDVDEIKEVLVNDSSIIRSKGHINTENGWILYNLVVDRFFTEASSVQDRNSMVVIQQKSSEKLDFDKLKKSSY